MCFIANCGASATDTSIIFVFLRDLLIESKRFGRRLWLMDSWLFQTAFQLRLELGAVLLFETPVEWIYVTRKLLFCGVRCLKSNREYDLWFHHIFNEHDTHNIFYSHCVNYFKWNKIFLFVSRCNYQLCFIFLKCNLRHNLVVQKVLLNMLCYT